MLKQHISVRDPHYLIPLADHIVKQEIHSRAGLPAAGREDEHSALPVSCILVSPLYLNIPNYLSIIQLYFLLKSVSKMHQLTFYKIIFLIYY